MSLFFTKFQVPSYPNHYFLQKLSKHNKSITLFHNNKHHENLVFTEVYVLCSSPGIRLWSGERVLLSDPGRVSTPPVPGSGETVQNR